MLEGWRWRFSRALEPLVMATVIIGNGQGRMSPRESPLILDELLSIFTEYRKAN